MKTTVPRVGTTSAVRRPVALEPGRLEPLRALAEILRSTLEADGVLIASHSGDGDGRVVSAVDEGVTADVLSELLPVVARVQRNRRALRPVQPLRDVDPIGATALAASGISDALCAPLEIDDERVGMLVLLYRRTTPPDGATVMPFARHVAVALAQIQQLAAPSLPAQVAEIRDAFDRVALSTTDPEDLTGVVADTVARILGVPMTALMIYDDEREVLVTAPGSFGASDGRVASYQVSVLDLHSNAARVFATGQPYLSNDAVNDPAIRPRYVSAFEIKRLLSVPLTIGPRRIGVLHLANKLGEFTLDDLLRAEALAAQVATVVELARTSFRLQRERRLAGVLSEMALAIASGEGLGTVLPPVLEQLSEVTQASTVALALSDSVPLVHRRCHAPAALEDLLLASADTHGQPRAEVVMPAAVGDPGSATFHVPVLIDDARVGTLSALRARGEAFAYDERQALCRVAQLAALAWATETYQQQSAQLARMQERRKISDLLHDDVQQLLIEARSCLDATMTDTSIDTRVSASVTHAQTLVTRGSAAVRSVSHQLARPPACDLPVRLRAAISSVEEEFAVPVGLDLSPEVTDIARGVPAPLADVLVRAAREALVNAAKHGGKCRISVRLRTARGGKLHLTVVDDGVGLTESGTRGHGLRSLQRALGEHSGRLQVTAAPGGGTMVMASVPMPD